MGIGTRASMIAAAAGAAGGVAALAASRLFGGDAQAEAIAGGVAGAACVAGAVAPFGLSLQRGVDRLRARLIAERGDAAALTPSWLKPVVAALAEAEERLAAESSRAAARVRDLEIRARVTEADLRQTAAVMDTIRDAVLVTNAYDELTSANAAAARLLGFRLPDALRRPVSSVIADAALVRHITAARTTISAGDRLQVDHSIEQGEPLAPEAAAPEPHPRLSLGADHEPPKASAPPLGETRHFEVTLAPLPGMTADPAGVVTILRDITREREISQMKSDFVSQVSHELRTPLSSINAYVEMLVDGEAKDEASRAEFYGVIKGEADRLGRLIDNMLNISRIEAGIFSMERTEVDFVAVAKQAVEFMQPQAALKRISLLHKSGPLVYTAQADRDMVLQVMLNLVSNAVKYTPEGGRVTVAVENDDATRSVLVSVSDTGLGIPPDAIPRLFEKFYRIENYKRVAKGTGLGLNLVKHIVETVHRGQVGVTSKVGMGSRFWFTIPFEPAARAAA